MTGDSTVYIGRSGKARVYHTLEDCYKLPDDYRDVEETVLQPHYRECKECAGEVQTPTHTGATLVPDDVREIRERWGPDVTAPELSEEYGVGVDAIYSVVTRKTWAWVE